MRSRAVAPLAVLAAAGVLGLGVVAVAAQGAGGGGGPRPGGSASDNGRACVADGDGGGQAGAGRGRGVQSRAGSGSGGWRAGSGQRPGAGADVPAPVPGASISDEVSEVLVFMVQEEKLARDVYRLASSQYPDRVFSRIAASESQHMMAVGALLDRYGIGDPTDGARAGEFADPTLAELYDSLADQVSTSRDEAVQAGITVERTDIADLRQALEMDAPADVDAVLSNLLAASQRHLAAFQRNA